MHALLSHEQAQIEYPAERPTRCFCTPAILASAEWEGVVHCERSLIMAYRCCSSTTHCRYATGALGMYVDGVASDPKTSELSYLSCRSFLDASAGTSTNLSCRKAKYKDVPSSMNHDITRLGLKKVKERHSFALEVLKQAQERIRTRQRVLHSTERQAFCYAIARFLGFCTVITTRRTRLGSSSSFRV